MPKELTHWYLADRALKELPPTSSMRKTIETHLSCYQVGAVLPDTLLHLFRGPFAETALDLSHRFHNAVDNSFAPLIRAEQNFSNGIPPAILACFLGVITHIQTDIVFHPFVYALTGTAGIGQHYRIETAIDGSFLSDGTIPANTHLSDMVTPKAYDSIITACALLFDPDGTLPRSAIEQALAEHRRIQAKYDKVFWKLAVRFLAIIRGGAYRDQQHLFYPLLPSNTAGFNASSVREWRHPASGQTQRSSLQNLADATVLRILGLFEKIEESGSLAETLCGQPAENMLTGMFCTPQKPLNSSMLTTS